MKDWPGRTPRWSGMLQPDEVVPTMFTPPFLLAPPPIFKVCLVGETSAVGEQRRRDVRSARAGIRPRQVIGVLLP